MAVNEIAIAAERKVDYPDRRAYIEGIKYYLRRIKSRKAVVEDESLYRRVHKFAEALKVFDRMDSDSELFEMDDIFGTFYPDGTLDEKFIEMGLQICFDSISEYLLRLKKLYRIGD